MADAAQTSSDFYFQGRHTPEAIPRPDAGTPEAQENLGVLAPLVGSWSGPGFNTIWRPHHPFEPQDRFLELNRTNETLVFTEIQGPIPNRGLQIPDIDMFGLTYMQQISDADTQAGLHVEPGIWVTVPATSDPVVPESVARLASIPHGTTILAQGDAFTVELPQIEENNIIPFLANQPPPPNSDFPNAEQTFTELNLSIPTEFRTAAAAITQDMVENPNSVLTAANQGVNITSTTVLRISTTPQPVPGGGTANTAFLGSGSNPPGGNANAAEVDAIFWIESVDGEEQPSRLQYTQVVQLDFNGLRWPHVTVATLTRNP